MQQQTMPSARIRPAGPLRAAIYARVSSDQQTERHTIDSQVSDLLARAAADGRDIGDEFRFLDDGHSGASLIRPALERLRDLHLGSALQALERRDLRPQFSDRLLQRGIVRQQPLGQGLQLTARQARKDDLLRRRHARNKSGPYQPGTTALAHLSPGFYPSYAGLNEPSQTTPGSSCCGTGTVAWKDGRSDSRACRSARCG